MLSPAPLISIIVPTHNRSHFLLKCLLAIEQSVGAVAAEVIVVANNCHDNTEVVASSFPFVKLVDEPRTAFSRARKTGAEAAGGRYLVFMDDDAELQPGTLEEIRKVFEDNPEVGLIAGRIEGHFENDPPAWSVYAQSRLNAWSLFHPDFNPGEGATYMKVPSACGPLMAIRSEVYQSVGGFPPDTIGVETNSGTDKFSKWYVGPGDFGLSSLVRKEGMHIAYLPSVRALHWVDKLRMSQEFFISRFYGEGCYLAISDVEFWSRGPVFRIGKGLTYLGTGALMLIAHHTRHAFRALESPGALFVSRLRVIQWATYLAITFLLLSNPNASALLWKMAAEGVEDNAFANYLQELPAELCVLLNSGRLLEAPKKKTVRWVFKHLSDGMRGEKGDSGI